MAAPKVDLPHWRQQFRRPRCARLSKTRDCIASGLKPRFLRTHSVSPAISLGPLGVDSDLMPVTPARSRAAPYYRAEEGGFRNDSRPPSPVTEYNVTLYKKTR